MTGIMYNSRCLEEESTSQLGIKGTGAYLVQFNVWLRKGGWPGLGGRQQSVSSVCRMLRGGEWSCLTCGEPGIGSFPLEPAEITAPTLHPLPDLCIRDWRCDVSPQVSHWWLRLCNCALPKVAEKLHIVFWYWYERKRGEQGERISF